VECGAIGWALIGNQTVELRCDLSLERTHRQAHRTVLDQPDHDGHTVAIVITWGDSLPTKPKDEWR
jgi:hypothetical protein